LSTATSALCPTTGGRLPLLAATCPVEFALGPLGPGPQIRPRFLQCRGTRLSRSLDAGQLCRVLALPAL
jgi:hypothetical protein